MLTGKEINYLHVCKRKLWLFAHGIRPELEFDNVQIGMLLQQESFSREKKEIPIGDYGVLDWADFADGIIHETKKGRSIPEADEAQAAYYLWALRQNGVNVHTAEIHYPSLRKTKTVEWSDTVSHQIDNDIRQAELVISSAETPELVKKNICKNCAFEEYCFA